MGMVKPLQALFIGLAILLAAGTAAAAKKLPVDLELALGVDVSGSVDEVEAELQRNGYIAAFRELWTQDEPVLDGDYVKMSDALFFPKPFQKPGPPIWTGGESPPAMRRAARLADGWYPIGSNPRFPLDTAARLAEGIATVKSLAEEAGRDPAEIDLGYWANWYRPGATRQTDNGERMLFTGADADVIDDIGRLRDLGVRHLLFNLVAGDTEQALDHIDRFTTEIRATAEG